MTDSKHSIALANTFISQTYMHQGDYPNALNYMLPAHYAFKEERQNGVLYDGYIGSPMTVGEIYLKMGQLDSAAHYLKESYDVLKKYGTANRYFIFHTPLLLAKLHLKRQELPLAYDFITEGLKNAEAKNDSGGICDARLELANYYSQVNQLEKSILNAQYALKLAQSTNRYVIILEASTLLKRLFQQKNDQKKALFYSEIANAAKDSLSGAQRIRQSQNLLFQEEQYHQNLETEKTAYRNRLMLYGLIAGLCLLGLLAWVLYLNYKRKQKENLLLSNEMKFQETTFQSKLVETEMTALRAQMNPHFIFNCLNSIKLHTLENNPIVASDYLTKFSKLIRLVLENSRSEKVTLVNELDMLQLYMEMEAMRFKDKMQFKINVEEGLDTHFIEIPPLLLQPYIENAIWHGLMHKEEGGNVILDIETKDEQMLRITITDDGIGRKAAAALKSKTATNNKSFGLKMTSERIGLINQLYKSDTQVQIEDLTDAEGNPKGTKVTLEIPI